MLLSFLKSSWYDRIARMTQYKHTYYNSDSDADSETDSESDIDSSTDSDEENQYHMVRIYDDFIIRYDNENIEKGGQKHDFNEEDYYFITYDITDSELERICKNCLNYTAFGVCIMVYILFVYVIVIIYK